MPPPERGAYLHTCGSKSCGLPVRGILLHTSYTHSNIQSITRSVLSRSTILAGMRERRVDLLDNTRASSERTLQGVSEYFSSVSLRLQLSSVCTSAQSAPLGYSCGSLRLTPTYLRRTGHKNVERENTGPVTLRAAVRADQTPKQDATHTVRT